MHHMSPDQLTIWQALEDLRKQEEAKRPYRNSLGEYLPWENELSIRIDKRISKGGE